MKVLKELRRNKDNREGRIDMRKRDMKEKEEGGATEERKGRIEDKRKEREKKSEEQIRGESVEKEYEGERRMG